MFCKYCGKQIPDDSRFCPECGKTLAPPASEPPRRPIADRPVPPPPAPAPKPSAPNRPSPAPFVLIFVLFLVWNTLYNLLLLSSRHISAGSRILITPFWFTTTDYSSDPIWLLGAAAVLVLVGLKKIMPRSVRWRDLTALALLSAVPLFQRLITAILSGCYMGRAAQGSVFLLLAMEQTFLPLSLCFWLVTLVFLLVRSGTLRVTWKKVLICLGILVLCSAALCALRGFPLALTAEKLRDIGADAMAYAMIFAAHHFLFFWLRGMAVLWWAADLGGKRLSLLGSVLFAAVTAAVSFGLIILLVVIFQLGMIGMAWSIALSYLAGVLVLFVFRMIGRSRRPAV